MFLDPQALLSGNETSDELLKYCWSQQECRGCLDRGPCSWCPTTSTCIPNTASIQLLAPIGNPDVCPHWAERWELRTRPLGCYVSTITFLACIVSILSTFFVIGLAVTGFKFGRWVRRKWKGREEGWWRGWRLRLVDVRRGEETEQSPLLREV